MFYNKLNVIISYYKKYSNIYITSIMRQILEFMYLCDLTISAYDVKQQSNNSPN